MKRIPMLMLVASSIFNPLFSQKSGDFQPLSLTSSKLSDTTAELVLSDGTRLLVDFYDTNIFRLYHDRTGKGFHDPAAKPEAKILASQPKRSPGSINIEKSDNVAVITTPDIILNVDANAGTFTVTDRSRNKLVLNARFPDYTTSKTTVRLSAKPDEYFFGGGVQNGRFSHKGKVIAIENQNSWTDGGVASPTPFYWSTEGYGIMWYTFKKGVYDFASSAADQVVLSHDTDDFDIFVMVSDGGAETVLKDFYQLTGNPVLMPKFAFYQGHLNAYNRDFWKEAPNGIRFEDGKTYRESQVDNGGIKETLNGENNNYQFSARAVIDRYQNHDMPLGWILPNDGYGAGYGQEKTLDLNVANLKKFGDYARQKGVEIGLWTQSDLYPKDGISALLQRDIIKEVQAAGVRVLKTDVAWVGAGYSFGLNGVADISSIMSKYGNNARPFIISLDGWAGTQRYAGVWTGDQTGGFWEYIRFHIPTYIGSGLSGQPNISSDMDGIFGGRNPFVNVRDFQWKAFTLQQLNMDGWGSNEKYPHALGEPVTSINRNYLKLKSELLPYQYSTAHQAVSGLPVMRPMFLQERNRYTLGTSTRYQYMFGSDFLVAPVYRATEISGMGDDIRNGIYLPNGLWIDYFNGDTYQGGRIINQYSAPLWKLPVFVKAGAIIPMANASNNPGEINLSERIYDIYPHGETSFTEYDDDGTTQEYLNGKYTTTKITSQQKKDYVKVSVDPTEGNFNGLVKNRRTVFKINTQAAPKKVQLKIGKNNIKLRRVDSEQSFASRENVWFYNVAPEFNRFSTAGSAFSEVKISKNPQIWVKSGLYDITSTKAVLKIKGFKWDTKDALLKKTGPLQAPETIRTATDSTTAYKLRPEWTPAANADYYELEFDGQIYSTVTRPYLSFEDLTPDTSYNFRIRSVNASGVSDWKTFQGATKADPKRFTIKNALAYTTAKDQKGYEVKYLTDGQETSSWHTDWNLNALPFDLTVDLKSVNSLAKLEYVPRKTGRNGIFTKGRIYTSTDRITWKDAGEFQWRSDNNVKTFIFPDKPQARFVKFAVSEAVGNFGSGQELYIYKVEGSPSYLQGDINNDQKVDLNDLTSYRNYTGLRAGDSDFEGYISRGDINGNKLIDAYDIAVAAAQVKGIPYTEVPPVQGSLLLVADKTAYSAGETAKITVKGKGLKSLHALSFALPYKESDMEFMGMEQLTTSNFDNYTNDRLHTDGEKVLHPTLVNISGGAAPDGDQDLMVLKFKIKRNMPANFKISNTVMVDKSLRFILK